MNRICRKNRVAVITGGARGIGFAVAERMLRSGAAVVVLDIDSAGLETAEVSLAQLGDHHRAACRAYGREASPAGGAAHDRKVRSVGHSC